MYAVDCCCQEQKREAVRHTRAEGEERGSRPLQDANRLVVVARGCEEREDERVRMKVAVRRQESGKLVLEVLVARLSQPFATGCCCCCCECVKSPITQPILLVWAFCLSQTDKN